MAAPSPVLLRTTTHVHSDWRRSLCAQYPDLDDETLADTLEGLTDLSQMLAALLRSALEDDALVSGLSTRLSEMKARLERLETRSKKKRDLVRQTMLDAGIDRLLQPDFSASLRQGAPAVDVQAEEQIPAAYWKPQPPKLDKLGLLAALKAGVSIDGATLRAPQSQLSVRTK